jgi:hypothetical protein
MHRAQSPYCTPLRSLILKSRVHWGLPFPLLALASPTDDLSEHDDLVTDPAKLTLTWATALGLQ